MYFPYRKFYKLFSILLLLLIFILFYNINYLLHLQPILNKAMTEDISSKLDYQDKI